MEYILGKKVIQLDSCDSTNRYAMSLVNESKDENGMVIFSSFQTAGQGQEENVWISNHGENILMSFIYNPHYLPPENQFLLSKTTSLAILDMLQYLLKDSGIKCSIKWPNDIYAGHRKIAGILIKNIVQGNVFEKAIVGIGININQTRFPDKIPNPASLKTITGKEYQVMAILDQLINCLNLRLHQLESGSFENIHRDYLYVLYRINQFKPYSYKGENITAKISGVDEFGRLILTGQDGKKKECDLKEITFLPDPNDGP